MPWLVVSIALVAPSGLARAHGVSALDRGTVVAAHASTGGLVRPSSGGYWIGAGVGVSHYWRHPDGSPRAGPFLLVAATLDALKVGPLSARLSESEWRPVGGLMTRVGFRVGYLEGAVGLVGPDPTPTGRVMVGVWFPNVVSVSAGVYFVGSTPFASATVTVGYGFRP